MNIIIRNMNVDDYNNLLILWKSCEGIGFNEIDDSIYGIERFLSRNPDTCFVAIKNSAIIGSIMAGHDGRRAHIYHLAVRSHYRREGIAGRLLENTINQLKMHNILKISLVVFKQNVDGNQFWEKSGFKARPDLVYRDKFIL
ncbi:MAG: GNAT family N-acetyltransferase [Desulfovibrio sp.]|nr:GNAT family N-acetyltransferase [Desulfovibrio sp.]